MSVSVNCWYCCEDSLVPAGSRDSWECPKCDQFNSFTSDGDVAPSVAAAGAQPRQVRYNLAVKSAAAAAARWQLCHQCNLQQQLKTRQLADFRPVLEQRWEQELEDYQRHLERVYQPCSHCQAVVDSALREADDRVRPGWLHWRRQKGTGEKDPGPIRKPPPASSRRARLWAVVRSAALKAGAAAHRVSAGLCSVCGVGVSLLLPAGLLLLLLLLCNSCLLGLRRGLVPAQYQPVLLETQDLFAENKAALVLFCFMLWVFTTGPGLNVQTLAVLLLWVFVCTAEMSVGQYMTVSTASFLQAVSVSGLLLLSTRMNSGRRTQATAARSRPSPVLKAAPSSSTPRVAQNGTLSGHSGPLSNGHVSSPAASPVPVNLPSPIPARPPAPSPQPEYDYNLPRLSLGSPRKSAGSGGVFALRTYQPAPGGALFSGGGRQSAPLLSPSRLRSELPHSAWIAGGYWQRDQPAPVPQLISRSSSQSSGFVDACGSVPPAAGSVLGEDDPRGWAGSQCDARSCAGDVWTRAPSCLGSQPSDWRSCAGSWRGPVANGRPGHDSSSMLSDRSLASRRTATSGLSEAAVTHRSLLVALVLGFSMAFNMFAVLLLVYRDRF